MTAGRRRRGLGMSGPEARRGLVEDFVGAAHGLPRVEPCAENRRDSATNSAPVAATASTEAMSDPAMTMQGISITSAHHAPSARLRRCGSGLLS